MWLYSSLTIQVSCCLVNSRPLDFIIVCEPFWMSLEPKSQTPWSSHRTDICTIFRQCRAYLLTRNCWRPCSNVIHQIVIFGSGTSTSTLVARCSRLWQIHNICVHSCFTAKLFYTNSTIRIALIAQNHNVETSYRWKWDFGSNSQPNSLHKYYHNDS